MKECKQYKNVSILDHGIDVWRKTKKIICADFENMKLPDWFIENHHWFINNIHDFNKIQCYSLWHDCSKPSCKIVDETGKQHFPNHAENSKKIFLDIFPDESLIAELIGLDMIMHTETYEQIMSRNLDIKTIATLFIVALAEINSNAEMFGDFVSASFKIKFKKLDKLGKKLFAGFPKHVDEYLYIFTRKDLPAIQQAVQSCHAVYELAKNGRNTHPSIIILQIEQEMDFKNVMSYLIDSGIQFKVFREPMEPYQSSITSIATEPLDLKHKELLKNFKLLKV